MKTTSQLFRRLALVLGMTTFLISAWAQNQATLTPIGQWPEYPLGGGGPVGAAGSYVYLAGRPHPPPQGSSEKATLRLVTLDVSSPSQPRYLSHVDTPNDLPVWDYYGMAMQIHGTNAYVVLGSGPLSTLEAFDLSQPAVPRLVGSLTLSGAASGIDVIGDHAFVSARGQAGWLHVIDVSNPAHPTLRTSVSVMRVAVGVSVAGNYAYVGGRHSGASYASVEIIDISDPGQAAVVGAFDIPQYDGGVRAIAAEGSLLHCYLRNYSTPGAYQVFDRTDPLNPSLISSCEDSIDRVAVSIQVVGSLVFLGGNGGVGFCIIDVADPRNPQIRGQVDPVEDFVRLNVANDLAYLCESSQLRVLDIKDPAAPVQLGQFDTGFWGPLLSIEGDLACLLDGPRLRVLNVSNPRGPTLVGAKDLEYTGPFKVLGSYGYVAAGSFLQILDLSNPSQPVEAGRISLPGRCGSIDVVGNRAYVTVSTDNWTGWLTVIDVANAIAPVELGSLYLLDSPGAPQVVGDFAYLRLGDSFGGDGLVVLNVRDPSQMVEVGRYQFIGGLAAFQVVGRYAYGLVRGSEDKGLNVLDLADPAHPTRVGRYPWEGETLALEELLVQGRYAFVTLHGDTNRVDILDVGDPTQPVKVGEYYAERAVSALAMAGNILYTTSDTGLTVLDFYAPNTSPNLRLNTPVLSGGVAVLTWDGGPGIKLQKTTSLTAPDWQDVPGTLGQSLIALPPTDTAAFFRLIQQ